MLLHYTNKWVPLDTHYLNKDSQYYYFYSETDELGFFVAIGKEPEKKSIFIEKGENPFTKYTETQTEVIRPLIDNTALKIVKLAILILCLFLTYLLLTKDSLQKTQVALNNKSEINKEEKKD